MAYQRSFKRPHVEDPVLGRALQQIDEEFGKILDLLNQKISGIGVLSITVGTVAPASPRVGDLWIDTNP